MQTPSRVLSSRPIAIWLLIGAAMIIVQVLLGGITRLTGSGLSITEWKPIMGALPPMNEQDWNSAFDKYQRIAQYKYINPHFTLQDFKFIFFWEWIHRLWARLIGVAFIIPFFIFLLQKRFKKEMIKPMIILFLLGALQGLVGWIMVRSGLEDPDRVSVDHYKLAIHFLFALGLLCYTVWFAFDLLLPKEQLLMNKPLRRFLVSLVCLLIIQLIFGAFMAGLKAAATAPTWPGINGGWLPGNFHSFGSREFQGLSFLTDHPIVVQFIHRNLAFLITVFIFIWTWKANRIKGTNFFQRIKWLPLLIVLVQVLLGILTVLNVAHKHEFLWLAVAHQFFGMILLLSLIVLLYTVRNRTISNSE